MASRKGFMLIELVVSLSVLSVGLLAISHSLVSSLAANKYSRDYTLACILAEEKLSLLEQSNDLSEGLNKGHFEEPYSRFSWKSKVGGNSSEKLKHVTITILWKDRDKQREVEFSTLLYRSPEI